MELQIGKRYKTGHGTVEEIGGLTKNHPEWVWTIQGNWYRKSDGHAIASSPVYDRMHNLIALHHRVVEQDTPYNLVEVWEEVDYNVRNEQGE